MACTSSSCIPDGGDTCRSTLVVCRTLQMIRNIIASVELMKVAVWLADSVSGILDGKEVRRSWCGLKIVFQHLHLNSIRGMFF